MSTNENPTPSGHEASESVMRRLKKLLTLASDPAAAPGEAENAMRMAQTLMAKYGVSDKELASAEIGEFMFKSTKATQPPVWESDLMWALAEAFGAKLLWYPGRGPRGARDKGHFVVLAPKHNLEMMKYGFEILRSQLVKQRTAYVAQLPRYLTRPEKAREADTFGVGFVQRLRSKISEYRGDARVEEALAERHRFLLYGDMTPEQIEALKKLREKRKQREFKLGSTAALRAGVRRWRRRASEPRRGVSTYRTDENPRIPGVYSVMINLHGIWCPRPHESPIYSYYDGVDTWGAWEFSESRALRAKPHFKGIRPWREVARPFQQDNQHEQHS